MTRLIVDDALRDKLDHHAAPVELCDHSGRLLGHFIPARQSASVGILSDACPYTEEELAAMRAEPGGRPLAEIWKSLGRG